MLFDEPYDNDVPNLFRYRPLVKGGLADEQELFICMRIDYIDQLTSSTYDEFQPNQLVQATR